ncbi:transcriptional regulator [Streptococcus agalactiae LMG 14747]|uniref:Transcriptional regulator n=1 Tax=Streptococcus agalactiae LMG 14747 TaxID=1154860 RepID=V6YYU6_STRAG|nr:helix-turn-helix transcriptional regulator [Streptococcus equi]ESV53797.1 transcriptional regulator [Streptococcus agalactiae LMG 14747]MDI5952788.1 helix-turn-helix transcriptional regulator [Streptococcus equi subsp. zooepidemicus]MDI6073634.1 helix-turn-helix transcriptional regulator [Streptococcus equi subsp. zooepidemicus]
MAKNSPQDLENREIFSANLNRLMSEKGIRQIDLHNSLDIPKSTITGYVKGRSLPTSGNVQKIADFLNVKKSDLDPRFQSEVTTVVKIDIPKNTISDEEFMALPPEERKAYIGEYLDAMSKALSSLSDTIANAGGVAADVTGEQLNKLTSSMLQALTNLNNIKNKD